MHDAECSYISNEIKLLQVQGCDYISIPRFTPVHEIDISWFDSLYKKFRSFLKSAYQPISFVDNLKG